MRLPVHHHPVAAAFSAALCAPSGFTPCGCSILSGPLCAFRCITCGCSILSSLPSPSGASPCGCSILSGPLSAFRCITLWLQYFQRPSVRLPVHRPVGAVFSAALLCTHSGHCPSLTFLSIYDVTLKMTRTVLTIGRETGRRAEDRESRR